jgi:hypothetical protein
LVHAAPLAAFLSEARKNNDRPHWSCCFSALGAHTLDGLLRMLLRRCSAGSRLAGRCFRVSSRHPNLRSLGWRTMCPPGRWRATLLWPYIPGREESHHAPSLFVGPAHVRSPCTDIGLSSPPLVSRRLLHTMLLSLRWNLLWLWSGGRADAPAGGARGCSPYTCGQHTLNGSPMNGVILQGTSLVGTRVWAIGHGPMGHGIAHPTGTMPALSRLS